MPAGTNSGIDKKDTFEMINALDGNAFWNAESIESLIFNSYVGGACVVELTEKHCEIIRANEKFQKELNTKHSVHELLKIDLFSLMSDAEIYRFQNEVYNSKQKGSEMRGEMRVLMQDSHSHEEYLRYSGRVIAQSSTCDVIYLLLLLK